MRFKIVVSTYNAMPYLWRCLRSIDQQVYREFDLCIVDDASTQPGAGEVIDHFCKRNGWKSLLSQRRRGPLASRREGVCNLDCDEDDVVILIDGDDWLFDNQVLSRLERVYKTGRYDLTYGQHTLYPGGDPGGKKGGASLPLSRGIMRKRNYRESRWVYFHLWSFRHFLWDAIEENDLRSPLGEYYRDASDSAFAFPLLEMANRRVFCFQELMYVYNRDNPLNENKVRASYQIAMEAFFRSRKPYGIHSRCQG